MTGYQKGCRDPATWQDHLQIVIMGWGTHSDSISDQIHWLTMQNSSEVGFHYTVQTFH